jgi:phosphopantetheinyl transferase
LFNNKLELKHYESGRPYIKEANHISISHSKTYIAIAFGEENIGIDIEQPQEKMLKLMPRILSKKEFEEFQKKPSTDLACKMWGTKESVLKYIGDKKLNYRDDIKIDKDSIKSLDLNFEVCFETVEEMILTYVMRKT